MGLLPPGPKGQNVPIRLKPHAIAAPRKKAQALLAAVGSIPGLTPEELELIPLEPYRAKLWGQRARKAGKLYWSQDLPEATSGSKESEVQVGQEEQVSENEDDEAGWGMAEAKDVYTKEQADMDGVSVEQWVNWGYSAFDLRHSGYSALDLATSGLFSAEALFEGGYSHDKLAYLDPDLLGGLAWASPSLQEMEEKENQTVGKGLNTADREEEDEISYLGICGL